MSKRNVDKYYNKSMHTFWNASSLRSVKKF